MNPRERATQALVIRGLEASPANLAWQVPRTIRAGRGCSLGLDLVPGIVLADVLDTSSKGVVMGRGAVVVEVWLDGQGERWTEQARALVRDTEDALETAGLRGLVIVRPVTMWARLRAWIILRLALRRA